MALRRIREMAVRRVLGGTRWGLAIRLLMEEMILMILMLIVALDIIPILGKYLSDFIRQDMDYVGTVRLPELSVWVGVSFAIAALSAIFPVLRLTGSKMAGLLRDAQMSVMSSGGKLRFVIISAQVAIGMGLGLASIGVFLQINHLLTMDNGYETENLIHIKGSNVEGWSNSRAAFAAELKKIPGVVAVSQSSRVPYLYNMSLNWLTNTRAGKAHQEVQSIKADQAFFEMYGIKNIAGQPLNRVGSREDILINMALARSAGFDKLEDLSGLLWSGWAFEGGKAIPSQLVTKGVVPNVPFDAGKKQTHPTYYVISDTGLSYISLRLASAGQKATLEEIRRLWDQRFPQDKINLTFAEDNHAKAYAEENSLGFMLLLCAALSTVVTFSGLAALARHEVIVRRREVALRRVLGASAADIIKLMFIKFGRPVLVGLVLGIPPAWYFLLDWTSSFETRFEPSLGHILLFAALALGFCLMLLFREALKAARVRPADALRCD